MFKLFSVDEMKVSALILVLFIVSGFALYKYFIFNDISSNILTLILGLITAVSGINIANIITNSSNSTTTTNKSNDTGGQIP